jgi:hypothetical protein
LVKELLVLFVSSLFPSKEKLDLATKEFRLRLLRKILSHGRPLAVVDELREFMEVPGVQCAPLIAFVLFPLLIDIFFPGNSRQPGICSI